MGLLGEWESFEYCYCSKVFNHSALLYLYKRRNDQLVRFNGEDILDFCKISRIYRNWGGKCYMLEIAPDIQTIHFIMPGCNSWSLFNSWSEILNYFQTTTNLNIIKRITRNESQVTADRLDASPNIVDERKCPVPLHKVARGNSISYRMNLIR